MQAQAPGAVGRLLCAPNPLVRGNTITCTVTGDSVVSWSFSNGTGLNVTGPSSGSTWSGTMAASGTVTAMGAKGETLTSMVTVTARVGAPGLSPISLPAAQLMANGSRVNGNTTLPTLTSPPGGNEEAFGYYAWGYVYSYQYSPIGAGPNQGLAYLTSVTDSSAFGWELNPGLTNPSDPFYQHQGNCFPTVQQIVNAVQAHEIGQPGPSHYSEAAASLQSNNPATAAEAVVAASASFQQAANSAIGAAYQAAANAAAFEPPLNLPSNINYPPYRTCP